jgi:hypothetical protein
LKNEKEKESRRKKKESRRKKQKHAAVAVRNLLRPHPSLVNVLTHVKNLADLQCVVDSKRLKVVVQCTTCTTRSHQITS